MKKQILFFISLLFCSSLYAQIGGISNSKLVVACTDPIPHKTMEFEPTFGFGWSNNVWDADGKSLSMDDMVNVGSENGMRLTFGIIENMEIGVTLPTDISSSSWGMRYKFLSGEKLSLAAIAGVNVPLGNRFYDKSQKISGNLMNSALGGVLSYAFSEKLSYDLDFQYQFFPVKPDVANQNDLFINTEIGFYIKDYLQLCGGVSYSASTFDDDTQNSNLLTLVPGATVETGNDYVIILAFPLDVMGKNNNKSAGVAVAVTFAID